MRDLSAEEREALNEVAREWGYEHIHEHFAEIVADVLAAVPRLREVEGMGVREDFAWKVRSPDGRLESKANETAAREYADWLNATYGPGHHAVRLAVVEVATPTPEAHDGDE
jgi:hypothetical protein